MKRLITALLALACAVPAAALAAEAEPKTQRAETVVVTAGRIAEKAKNVTASVTVIPREEIEKNQYQDISGLLRNQGIQVNGYAANGSLSQVTMRGVRTSLMGTHGLDGSILLLVDGRRVGTDNISMVPLVNVERIEIIRGPAAVQYGTSAIGGVINVITRRGTTTPAIMAEAGLGSWDAYKTQGSAAWAKGPLDFSGGVSYLTTHDYRYGGGKRYPNTGLNYKTAYNLNTGFTFLDDHRIGMTLIGVRADEMGSPGYYNDRRDEYTDRAAHSADFSYEGGYKDAGLSWKGRYFSGNNTYLSDEWGNAGSGEYFKSGTRYQGAQGQVSFVKSVLTLTGGMDWNNYDTRFWGAYYAPHEHSEYDNLGVFTLAKLAFFDESLILSGGLRHDAYTLKVQGKDKDLDNTTPSLGIAWHATNWLTFRSNYGESYRVPQATEMLGFRGMFTYIGNPDLKPEKGKTIDAGVEVAHKGLHLGLTYFRTDYKEKIASRFDWNTNASQYYNQDGTAKLRGLEATASYDIGEAMNWPIALRPYVNLTRMLEREDNEGNTLKNVSNLDLGYGVGFAYPKIGLDVDFRLTYYGKQEVDDWNSVSNTYGQNVTIGGRTVADLFVTQTLYDWDRAGKLSLKAELRNIGDDKYVTIKDYYLPGRSFYLGLRYDY